MRAKKPRYFDAANEEINDPVNLRREFRESVTKGQKFEPPKDKREASRERRTKKRVRVIGDESDAGKVNLLKHQLEGKGYAVSTSADVKRGRSRGRPKRSKKVGGKLIKR